MAAVDEALERIKGWMRARAQENAREQGDDDDGEWVIENNFKPPVSEQALVKLEQTIGFELPPAMRELLLEHDGSALHLIEATWELLPADNIAAMWRAMSEADPSLDDAVLPDPGVRRHWFNRKWIPVAHSGGDYLLVDLDPSEGGIPGQLIRYFRDTERRLRVATGLGAWLSSFADDLEAGRYALEEDTIQRA